MKTSIDENLLLRVRAAMADEKGVSERRMFGGVSFIIDGNMACGVLKSDLLVRVGAEAHEAALKSPHARPMDFTGRPAKGFVLVSADGVRTEAALRKWTSLGAAFARSLPKKAAKPPRSGGKRRR